MDREFTDAEVEWAAECLSRAVHGGWPCASVSYRDDMKSSARHALERGYVPPPKPRSVRDEVFDLLIETDRDYVGSISHLVDALLARFDVTRKP